MPLTKKQQEYLLNCNHRWNVKTGATGSGKSFVDFAVTIPKRILAAKGQGLLVMLGNTKGTLERNILDPMREIWSPDLVGNISSDNTVQLFGKKVYALGADNKKHMARIQGATFEYVYGDEVTTWSEEVFQMLKSRLRCEHSRFDGTCNPDNPHHWFKQFLESDADIYQQSYTIDDGALPANVVAELKKEYAGTVYYNRFILGQWTAAEGLIYRLFTEAVNDKPHPNRFSYHGDCEFMKINLAIDFGGSGSGHAFVATGVTPAYQQAVALASERHFGDDIDPEKLGNLFVDFASKILAKYGMISTVYCDSAEQVLIRGIRKSLTNAGLGWIRVANALKSPINDRIRLTSRLMAQGRFFYVPAECQTLEQAFCTAVWSKKQLTKDERLDDGSSDIDSLDAFEYTIERDQNRFISMEGVDL